MSMCDTCKYRSAPFTGTTPSGFTCSVSAPSKPLTESGQAVRACSYFQDRTTGRKALCDRAGRIG